VKNLLITAVVAAVLLSACGGGGDGGNQTSNASITSVKVVGASLADSGTFGYTFTVQPSNGTSYQVYSERIASTYGLASLCAAYTYVSASSAFAPNSSCTNYAVAGATINNYNSTYGAVLETIPTSAIKQLADAGNAGFGSKDLLIVGEASANDAAALTTAYVYQALYSTTDFSTLVATLVTSSSTDPTELGTLYMQALADKLVAAVKTNALDKGATHVAILNTLDVTRTPKFQATLAQIAAATDSATATGIQTMVNAWIQAYNARLAADVVPYASNVVIVDFYTAFNAQLANPTSHGLTNTSATVCDEVLTGGAAPGVTSLSDPSVVAVCTGTNASNTSPSAGGDGTANWWKSWLFADNFHPTPYGHQLLAQIVADRLTAAGWM
jgi:outer membrane lipase/esterase